MSQVLLVLFRVNEDGSQVVVSTKSFDSREDAIAGHDALIASHIIDPSDPTTCHTYQVDLVDRQSITDLVQVYIPNTNASINFGNQTWQAWLDLKPGDVSPVDLGGDYMNTHTKDSICGDLSVFNPVPGDGSPAVPLNTASSDAEPVVPVAAPPTPTPAVPAPVVPAPPVAIYTAVTSQPITTHDATMPNTGAYGVGPLAGLGTALFVIGAWLVRKSHTTR